MTVATWKRFTCDFCGRPAGGAPVDQPFEVEHVVLSSALVPEGVDLAGDMSSPLERRLDVCTECVVHVNRALASAVRAARRARVAGDLAAVEGQRVTALRSIPSPDAATLAASTSQTAHATAHGG